MIAKMKKLTFLVYHKEYDAFLKSIRELGVVHIAERAQGGAENTSLQDSIRLSGRYSAAIKLMQTQGVEAEKHVGDALRGEQALKEIESLLQARQQVAHRLQTAEKEVSALEAWGNFNPEDIHRLHDAGYQINFFVCAEKQFDPSWVDCYNATEINRIGSKIYFVTITSVDQCVELDVEAIKLPEQSLNVLQAQVEGLHKEDEELASHLKKMAETVIPISTRFKAERGL